MALPVKNRCCVRERGFSLGQPACLFETYLMPPPLSMGTFGAQPSLTPFLALIDQIQGTPPAIWRPATGKTRPTLQPKYVGPC